MSFNTILLGIRNLCLFVLCFVFFPFSYWLIFGFGMCNFCITNEVTSYLNGSIFIAVASSMRIYYICSKLSILIFFSLSQTQMHVLNVDYDKIFRVEKPISVSLFLSLCRVSSAHKFIIDALFIQHSPHNLLTSPGTWTFGEI